MINHLVNQRYEVLEKVGESPLFTVYKARDKQGNRVVALKAVTSAFIGDRDFVDAFDQSLKTSGLLNHPNITRFYEFGVEDGTPFASFEFVRGIDLKERIRRIAPFTLSVAVDFSCAIGEALHYAHNMGQVHGDLRSQNVIVSPEGAVKVTDFGLQAAVAKSPAAQELVLLRSAPYHPPELSMRHPGTPAGDIYSLGATLYEMLTGTPLYSGGSSEAIADQHAFAAIPLAHTLNPGVPRSVEGILLKCLQKAPEDRYRSAADLLNDLKSVRDALRFGKPLSWSPVDIEKLSAAPAPPRLPPPPLADPVVAASSVDTPQEPVPTPVQRPAPVQDVIVASQTNTMPSSNRLRASDERVSIYLKFAIAGVTAVIFGALVVFAGVCGALWAVPRPIAVPEMVGKSIEDVRQMAADKHVHLIEHSVFSEKPRDIVYKTDPSLGDQIRPNHNLNIWYSKGPTYVNVPNVMTLQKEDAEQKLKDAGLTIGKEITEFSAKVPINCVMHQDVSYKKRVLHDTAVGLLISDGPKPDYATGDANPGDTANPDPNGPDPTNPGAGDTTPGTGDVAPTPPPADQTEHSFDRTISIPKDGKGERKVRIEVTDSQNLPMTVINEDHKEGDKIPVTFVYLGKTITLRIFYNDQVVFSKSFDPLATRNKRIQ